MVSDRESYREKIVARAWDDATKIAIFDGFGCSLVNSLFLALYFYFQHVVLDFNAHATFRCHTLFQCHAPFRYAYYISMLMLNLILNEVDPLLVKWSDNFLLSLIFARG